MHVAASRMGVLAPGTTQQPKQSQPFGTNLRQKSMHCCDCDAAVEHSITWEDDIWRADPVDVDLVHAAARRRFSELLGAVKSARGGAAVQARILLFHGQSGAGKTHLLRALRIPFIYLDDPGHVVSRIRKAQTLAQSANKPVALLLCRDLMWEEPA